MSSGINGYEKVPWFLTRPFQMKIFFFFIALFLSEIIIWLGKRRRSMEKNKLPPMRWGLALSTVGLFTVGGLLMATEIPEQGTLFDHGIPLGVSIITGLPLVFAIFLLPYFYFIIKNFSRATPIWFIAHQFLLMVASGLYLWWTYYWNLTLLS